MYLDHFGLSESPYRITPHTEFFFAGGNRGSTLDALLYAITHDEGIVKVSGEVGSGKTMLCRVLMERLPDSVTIIYLSNPSLSREDILYAIADDLHLEIPSDARAAVVLRTLQNHLIDAHGLGRQVVVLIDEAHAMPAETLEEIRLLSNLESNRHKLLQLVLFGQPELNDVLARSDMRQLKERITHNFSLEPLVLADIGQYLEFRLRAAGYKGPNPFTAQAIQLIAKSSLGLTRRINILAEKCLLSAYARNSHQIGVNEAKAAIRDCDFSTATDNALLKSSRRSKAVRIGILLFPALAIAAATFMALRSDRESALEPSLPTTSTQTSTTRTIGAAKDFSAESSPQPPGEIGSHSASQPDTQNASLAPPQTLPNESPKEAPEQTGPLTRRFIKDGHRWLTGADDQHWFIQLMASDGRNPEAIESFLQRIAKSGISIEQVRVYFVDTDNIQRFGVIYGEFETRAAATKELRTLPSAIHASRPFVRQVAQLR